ncbi:MAG: ABC transporter ATP-binding protein [Thermoanaerobaculia bacterium]|nr:ABC transporter ATP-binding protein [Thermoanaerobaculia bacterium]
MTTPLLSATALTRTYAVGEERVVGVRDAALSLERGELAVLAGPSGSGKTTLLNLLGLLDRPDSGRLELLGEDVSTLDDRGRARLRREKLGFVFQSHQLVPVLSAEENVALALWIRGLPDEECRVRSRAALAAVGLARMEGRRPDAMSGGQRQRVAVARAIVGEPALVLADEPTASLDSETAARLLDLFDALHAEKGIAFLFSSHDPRIVERVPRRVRLVDGRIASDERTAGGTA